MFGESESESPRVPSPWDNLISSPPSPSPRHSPSPLSIELELIPRLVPEADDGNVEYKLQLLDPSPARFARLVTQMKWRLLEGGGQAYYELGVADSGDLIGLPRAELERSLETLEMMAGEIGASVIVVKEIEVPAAMAMLARRSGEWAGGGGRRAARRALEDGDSTATETEAEAVSTAGSGDDVDDLSLTVVLERDAPGVFMMDSESEESAADDGPIVVPNRFSIDLEISSVFKPRPVRTRVHNHAHPEHPTGGKNKRVKKHKHLNMLNSAKAAPKNDAPPAGDELDKAQLRRQGRDRRRDEKRKALEARATQAVEPDAPLTSQESVSVVADAGGQIITTQVIEKVVDIDEAADDTAVDDDDDVFASPTSAVPSFPTFSALTTGESHLDVDAAVIGMVGALIAHKEGEEVEQPRLIVEALVVRKISLEEAFLDFGGFSLT